MITSRNIQSDTNHSSHHYLCQTQHNIQRESLSMCDLEYLIVLTIAKSQQGHACNTRGKMKLIREHL